MFQYAFGRALSCKLNTEVVVDSSFFNNINDEVTTKRELDICNFQVTLREVSIPDLKSLKPFRYRIVNAILYKLGLNCLQNSHYFFENQIGYNRSISRIKNNCFISGYWQSYKYFNEFDEIIRNDFSFPSISNSNTLNVYSKINNSNSVSIHIRRGDFLNNSLNNIHAVCSLDYYNSAVKFIQSTEFNPFFFIFSDDIEWAKVNFKLESNCFFVDGSISKSSFQDLQLMSVCKHNIIANSSFSWWAAWLNANPKKVVVAPKLWYNDNNLNNQTVDLIPTSWVRL